MDRTHLRHVLLAVVPRAEVTPTELRLYVSCHELSRYLAWDDVGFFNKNPAEPVQGADRVHVVHAPAFLICGQPIFALAIRPCADAATDPDPYLVKLLRQAAELREFVLANRKKSIRQLAAEKRMGQSFFARVLRINYLAPDIQAAIIDGTQPARVDAPQDAVQCDASGLGAATAVDGLPVNLASQGWSSQLAAETLRVWEA